MKTRVSERLDVDRQQRHAAGDVAGAPLLMTPKHIMDHEQTEYQGHELVINVTGSDTEQASVVGVAYQQVDPRVE